MSLSFPRKRESNFTQRSQESWMPAFAGMTNDIARSSTTPNLHYIMHRPSEMPHDDIHPVPVCDVLAADLDRPCPADPFGAGHRGAQFLPGLDSDRLDHGAGLGPGGQYQPARHRDR